MAKKILLIDDEKEIILTVGNRLKCAGFEIVGETFPKKAWQKLEARQVDLCLTWYDIMMPEMDGLEVLRTLKSNPQTQHIPVVMLTAKTSETTIHEAKEIGDADFLIKPLHHETFLGL